MFGSKQIMQWISAVILVLFCLHTSTRVVNGDESDDDKSKQFFIEEQCNKTISVSMTNNPYGYISVRREGGYSTNQYCRVGFLAPANHHLLVTFQYIDFYIASSRPTCSKDYVMFRTNASSNEPKHCVTHLDGAQASSLNYAEFIVASGPVNDNKGFAAYYNVFYQKGHVKGDEGEDDGDDHDDDDHCKDSEFECDNDDRCISEDLQCNGYDNCGDSSDEECGLSTGAIIGIAVACSVVGLTLILVGVYCYMSHRKPKTDKNRVYLESSAVSHGQSYAAPYDEMPPPYSSNVNLKDPAPVGFVPAPPYYPAAPSGGKGEKQREAWPEA